MKIKKKPTPIFRGWRWESDFDERSFHSIGNLQVRKGAFWVSPKSKDLNDFLFRSHRISICVKVICMNEDDEWRVTADIHPDKPCRVSEFEEFYFDLRNDLVNSVQKRHICDVGWVIRTYANQREVDGDKWWQVGDLKATKERQQLWRYYHNVVKYEDDVA